MSPPGLLYIKTSVVPIDMNRVSFNGMSRLTFHLLERIPRLVHGVFMRHGGVSAGPFHSLNVGLSSGDDRENVSRNRDLIRESLDLPVLTWARQKHGDSALFVEAENMGPAGEADALVTSRIGVGLMIKLADCQSIMLFDPENRAVANVHCGWRGSVKNVISKTVAAMVYTLGSDPSGMIAAVGPSLGPCCAEYTDYAELFPKSWEEYRVGKAHFDFWTLTLDQLKQAGLRPEHVEMARICTKCSTTDFFSYRGEKITGRFASVIALR